MDGVPPAKPIMSGLVDRAARCAGWSWVAAGSGRVAGAQRNRWRSAARRGADAAHCSAGGVASREVFRWSACWRIASGSMRSSFGSRTLCLFSRRASFRAWPTISRSRFQRVLRAFHEGADLLHRSVAVLVFPIAQQVERVSPCGRIGNQQEHARRTQSRHGEARRLGLFVERLERRIDLKVDLRLASRHGEFLYLRPLRPSDCAPLMDRRVRPTFASEPPLERRPTTLGYDRLQILELPVCHYPPRISSGPRQIAGPRREATEPSPDIRRRSEARRSETLPPPRRPTPSPRRPRTDSAPSRPPGGTPSSRQRREGIIARAA